MTQIQLDGRTALVSGSTQGIGFAIAEGLARAGAAVVVNGRSDDTTTAAAERLAELVPGAAVTPVPADLATAEGAEALGSVVPDVDILVNNLGIFGATPALEITDEEWRRYFEVNVLSAVRLIRMYLPGMQSRSWGRVVDIPATPRWSSRRRWCTTG